MHAKLTFFLAGISTVANIAASLPINAGKANDFSLAGFKDSTYSRPSKRDKPNTDALAFPHSINFPPIGGFETPMFRGGLADDKAATTASDVPADDKQADKNILVPRRNVFIMPPRIAPREVLNGIPQGFTWPTDKPDWLTAWEREQANKNEQKVPAFHKNNPNIFSNSKLLLNANKKDGGKTKDVEHNKDAKQTETDKSRSRIGPRSFFGKKKEKDQIDQIDATPVVVLEYPFKVKTPPAATVTVTATATATVTVTATVTAEPPKKTEKHGGC
ncbi:hypothetical protein VTI74DRAFT_11001 [Chaetomium olivicolor]